MTFVDSLDKVSLLILVVVVVAIFIAFWKARRNGKGKVGPKGTGQGR